MKYELESLPKELRKKDKRDEYANQVCNEIRAGVMARRGLEDRWKKNQDYYFGINDHALPLVPGSVPIHMPIVGPLLDRINGTVFQAITSVEPYVQVLPEMDDMGIGDAVERDLQFLLKKAHIERKLWAILKIASVTGCGMLRLRYENTIGFVFDVVHPTDFVVYPSSSTTLDLTKTCGHRFYRTLSQIKSKQKSGEWIDYPDQEMTTTSALKDEAGRNSAYSKVTEGELELKDSPAELWEVIRKESFGDMGEVWYKCVVALDSQKLLDCKPFGVFVPLAEGVQFIPHSTPDYFDFRYDDEYGIFWPSGSPAQSLQAIQGAMNDAFNIWYWGNVSTAFPVTVITGGSLGKKLEKMVPGMIIEADSNVQAQVIGSTFNGSGFEQIIDRIQMYGEGAVRINRMAIGQELKSHTTATAAAGQMEMQRQSEDQYTEYISLCLQNLYTYAYELYRMHHQDIVNTFGPSIEVKEASALENVRFTFEVNGKKSSNNPQALIGKLQMLLQMAMTPGTTLSYPMIEQAVIRAMQLPFSTNKITIPPEAMAQGLMGAAQGGELDPGISQALGSLDEGSMGAIIQQLNGAMAPQLPDGQA